MKLYTYQPLLSPRDAPCWSMRGHRDIAACAFKSAVTDSTICLLTLQGSVEAFTPLQACGNALPANREEQMDYAKHLETNCGL